MKSFFKNLPESLNLSLGEWGRIPITCHWSLIMMVVLISLMVPSAIFVIVPMFFILLLHEFGHCAAARYFGVEVRDITLYSIGGVASIQLSILNPAKEEFWITVAGPLVNVLFVPVIYLASFLTETFLGVGFMLETINTLYWTNLVMLVFNLAPAYPMDGGRILRSFLRRWWNIVDATRIAVRTSQVTCLIGAVASIYFGFVGMFLVAVVIFFVSEMELHSTKKQAEDVRNRPEYRNARRENPNLGDKAILDEAIKRLHALSRSADAIDRP